ncbi:hypothetical protein BOTBODRAFT_101449 [Botryobasidium botryosum FD-172 SS1]|uniref:Glutamine synthetase n=1 Tax=Botryobasidium botryosum (strain FD-172 SS1) TaxID=930990 RepID=A0A067MWF6_BOTB1|nr:hypothetical protein BOTBODRAFT_101449 [Botryobasidium botryosum FD-172 SS1]
MSGQTVAAPSLAELKSSGIRFIRFIWVDLINCVRYRVIPIDEFKRLIESSKGGISIAKPGVALVFLNCPEGFTSTGEYNYKPDFSSLRISPYADGHASVMGWFSEKEPVKGIDGKGSLEVPLCPRTILRRVVESAKQSSGVEFLTGYEIEFILLKSTSPIEAVNDHGWSCSAAIPSGTAVSQALDEMAQKIIEAGIVLQMYHSEAAPGQYEFVTGPLPPLQAADALVHTRETISNVASKYGFKATFAPRVYQNSCGSGAHTHISLKSDRSTAVATVEGAAGMTEVEASWLQSLLNHLPAAVAFTLPTPASYDRMADGVWSGGTHVAWGRDNRECPVRLCGMPGEWNFEVKTGDATANPYLALAALLSAGMIGVREQIPLKAKNCIPQPSSLLYMERVELGITERFPFKVQQAWERLVADEALVKELGKDFVKQYIAVGKVRLDAIPVHSH